MVDRCSCCGQILKPPAALCDCGHPMGSHHLTERGNTTYCTVWDGPSGQCPCQKGIERKEAR